jgi:hypothetical protein
MAGYPLTALDINNKAGQVARAVWQSLDDAHAFSLWLADAAHTDTLLGPTGVGVTSADLVTIRAATVDLGSANGRWGVAHGQKTVTAVNDFFFNAKLLGGIYWTG